MAVDPLRLAGIAVISFGGAAIGWVAGYGPADQRQLPITRRGIHSVVWLLTFIVLVPIVVALVWAAIGQANGWPIGRGLPLPAGSTPTREILFNIDLTGRIALYAVMAPPVALLMF